MLNIEYITITKYLYSFVLFLFTHGLLKTYNWKAVHKIREKGIWFFIHFIGNMYVIYHSMYAIYYFFSDFLFPKKIKSRFRFIPLE